MHYAKSEVTTQCRVYPNNMIGHVTLSRHILTHVIHNKNYTLPKNGYKQQVVMLHISPSCFPITIQYRVLFIKEKCLFQATRSELSERITLM